LSVPKIVVDTDLFVAQLTQTDSPSVLRKAMAKFFCYTTIFQAIELFAMTKSPREAEAAERAMAAVKLLGVNARGAQKHTGS
jgi:hypothetical protein